MPEIARRLFVGLISQPLFLACVWGNTSGYPDPVEVPVSTEYALSELDIFTSGRPITFSFRDDYLGQQSYTVFSNTISQSFGHAPKMFSEERVASIANQPYMAQYAIEHPEKLLLCHYNGKQIKVMRHAEFADFFPGHWLYYPGSSLTSAVSAVGTTISVQSAANFQVNSVVALIPLGAGGERLWDNTEFAVVTAKSGTNLTVLRGQFRTSAKSFPQGTYVAIHPEPYEGNDTSFQFNWSADAPLDSLGRNCGDVFVKMMTGYFQPGGALEKIHGILFDVLFWEKGDPVVSSATLSRKIDTDADGFADNGYNSAGENRFAAGVTDMVRKLRLALGPNRIITGDGNGEQWPRLPHLLNGMESEGLTAWHDPFATEWSSNINNFLYWKAHQGFPQDFNFIVDKLPTLTDAELAVHKLHLQRLAGAVATILDIGVKASGTDRVFPERRYELYDHLKKGLDNQLGWLGEPGKWIRPAAQSPNLFHGNAGGWTSTSATVTDDPAEAAWKVSTTGNPEGPSSQSMTITYSGQAIPAGDLFISFKLKAAKLTAFPEEVYRYVTVMVDGRQANPETADELTAIASNNGYSECGFYYREAGPATVAIHLKFEGPQNVWIKDFTVHNASDVLARSFDNGVVLANPTTSAYTFNLDSLFPGRLFWRIQGSAWEDPVTNNGDPVSGIVQVPGLDGLFLVSRSADLDNDQLPDDWEYANASDLVTLGLGGTDSTGVDFDGDGASDAFEYSAGTSPVDPADRLVLGIESINPSTIAIRWNSVIKRKYIVLWSPDLKQWNSLPETYPGTGATIQNEFIMPFQGLEPTVFFSLSPSPL